METVPDPKPFPPFKHVARAAEGVFREHDAPVTRRRDFCPDTPGLPDGSFAFCLHTVQIQDEERCLTLPQTGSTAVDLGQASEEELVQWRRDRLALEAAQTEAREAIGAAHGASARPSTRRMSDTVSTVAVVYMTGQLPGGRKVGVVSTYRPHIEVELPVGKTEEWFRAADVVSNLAYRLGLPAGMITCVFHRGSRFKGYVPDPTYPTQRYKFMYARMHFPNMGDAKRAAGILRRGLRVKVAGGYAGRGRGGGFGGSSFRRGGGGGGGGAGYRGPTSEMAFNVYEDRIDMDQKFIVLYELAPSEWHVVRHAVRVPPAGQLLLVDAEYRLSNPFDMKVACDADCGRWGISPAALPCLSVVSLDCEMNPFVPDRFPTATRATDAVVAVGLVFAFAGGMEGLAAAVQGTAGSAAELNYAEYERRLFVLADACDPIPGVVVVLFSSEQRLLQAVRRELFVHKQIDVLLGHNTTKFDIKYMADRVACFGTPADRVFMRFGALPGVSVPLTQKSLTSPALGTNVLWLLNGVGFAYVDTLLLLKANHKLRENTLKFALDHFLAEDGVAKYDMPYNLIPAAIAGPPGDVKKLAAYCVQDCVGPLRLVARWDSLGDFVAQSRIINILMADNVISGQQVRVRNTLMKRAHASRMVMNGVNEYVERDKGRGPGGDDDDEDDGPAVGGLVLDSKTGLYDCPVIVLDFQSLYPSIQQLLNLCWSTVYGPGDGKRLPAEELADWAAKGLHIREFVLDTKRVGKKKYYYFVQNVPGLFPQQLRALLETRLRYKAEMRAHPKGSPAYQNANNAQLATKVVMNSGYGTANASGVMPCKAVGSVTCFHGRELNCIAKDFCVKEFGAEVVYGDTDSLMMKVPMPPGVEAGSRKARLAYAMDMGERMAAAVNEMFFTLLGKWQWEGAPDAPPEEVAAARAAAKAKFPLKIEFEKCMFPFLAVGKKTYAGLKLEPGDLAKAREDLGFPSGTIESKGLSNVRRDRPRFIAPMTQAALHALFYDHDEDAFWDVFHTTTEKVANCLLPLQDYTATQAISGGYLDQPYVRPHVAVSFARERRIHGSAFVEGDRVAYVIVQEPDPLRVVKPEWLVSSVEDHRGARIVRAESDGEDYEGNGHDDVRVRPGSGPGPGPGLTWRGLGGGAAPGRPPAIPAPNPKNVAQCARLPEEVEADPDNNHLNVVHYVDTIVSVLKQLMPQHEGPQEVLMKYAEAAQEAHKRARCVARGAGMGAHIVGGPAHSPPLTTADIMARLPKLSHRRPDAAPMSRLQNLMGEVVPLGAHKPKAPAPATAQAPKPPIVVDTRRQMTLFGAPAKAPQPSRGAVVAAVAAAAGAPFGSAARKRLPEVGRQCAPAGALR
jgi:DNA polymerase elongation subunit (family B)